MNIMHMPHFQSTIPIQRSWRRYNTGAPTLYLWSFLTKYLMFPRLYKNSYTKIIFIKCTYKTILVGEDISQLAVSLEHLSSVSGTHVYFSFKADMVACDCNTSAGMGRMLTRGQTLPA